MPSSTSSSDPPRPTPAAERKLWLGTWGSVLLVVLLCVGAWELGWRGRGFEPSLSDDAMLWSLARREASREGSEAIALVGSSRMQMDIHRETFAAATGWRPAVQLALVHGPSRLVLAHLADDESFRGTVLCEINPTLFYNETSRLDRDVANYIATYEDFTVSDWIEEQLAIAVQGNLVSRLPELRPMQIRRALVLGRAPEPSYAGPIGRDRYRYADYRRVPNMAVLNRMIERQLSTSASRVLGRDAFAQRVREMHAMADRIVSRGGRVIFLRLPSNAEVRSREERLWPRASWWDVFASPARNVARHPAIHYRDEPGLAEFTPPDGDHLGKMQAIDFSMRLGRILVRRNLAPGPQAPSGTASR